MVQGTLQFGAVLHKSLSDYFQLQFSKLKCIEDTKGAIKRASSSIIKDQNIIKDLNIIKIQSQGDKNTTKILIQKIV